MNTDLLDKAGRVVSDVVESATAKLPSNLPSPRHTRGHTGRRAIVAVLSVVGTVVLLVLVGSRLARSNGGGDAGSSPQPERQGNASRVADIGHALHTGTPETVRV